MIGDKIRELRKARRLTQEQLADYLNVSSQAVSKWETGASSPDLDMLPRLAVFFRTTPDALLDFDRQRIDAEVNALVSQCCPFREDPVKAEAVYREALKKYPNNEKLLNYLLMVLPSSRAAEKLEIGERLLDSVTDETVRFDVLRLLSQTCHSSGKQAMAERYWQRLPEPSYLKSEIGAAILEGEAQLREIEKTENICLTTLCAMLLLRQRRAESEEDRERLRALCDELLALLGRESAYQNLVNDISGEVRSGEILDSYQ